VIGRKQGKVVEDDAAHVTDGSCSYGGLVRRRVHDEERGGSDI
jgi:hypothetical protein